MQSPIAIQRPPTVRRSSTSTLARASRTEMVLDTRDGGGRSGHQRHDTTGFDALSWAQITAEAIFTEPSFAYRDGDDGRWSRSTYTRANSIGVSTRAPSMSTRDDMMDKKSVCDESGKDEKEIFIPRDLSIIAPISGETLSRSDDQEKQREIPVQAAEKQGKPGQRIGIPPGPPTQQNEPDVVNWDGPNDKENPMNWSTARKWLYTILLGLMTFVVTFASSVFSTAIVTTSVEFGVSEEVMVLGVSLFVLGFAFGPILWGPLSELYGRRIPLFVGYTCFAIFQVPVAVASNLETILICRFLGGLCASAPLAVVGATLNDFWDPVNRGLAVCVFSAATFIGPIAGPIVGGFVTESYLGWRWTAWLTLIAAGAFGIVGFVIVPESYAPVLLSRRAKTLRHETKNWALHAKSDETEIKMKDIFQKYLLRPFQMMALEPILLLMTIYMSFIYGVLYLFFEVYPIVFQQQRGWSLGVGALPFLGILGGVVVGSATIVTTTLTRFKRKLKETGHVVPEERLVPMMIGGVLLPIGLFWFAWTSSPDITPWPQIISGIPIGAGIQMIFLQGLVYIIDVYKMYSASAIAGNTFFRSWVGAGLPLAAVYMYNALGVDWATSLLGFVAIVLFPVPILFYIFGAKIRKMSKYVPQMGPGGKPPWATDGGGPPPWVVAAGGGPPPWVTAGQAEPPGVGQSIGAKESHGPPTRVPGSGPPLGMTAGRSGPPTGGRSEGVKEGGGPPAWVPGSGPPPWVVAGRGRPPSGREPGSAKEHEGQPAWVSGSLPPPWATQDRIGDKPAGLLHGEGHLHQS